MKLELKHLAPYLPYGLRINDDQGNNGILAALFNNCLYLRYDLNVGDYEYEFSDVKPILRPLSDLTKFSTEIFELFDTTGKGVKWAVIEDVEILGNFFYHKDKIVPILDIRSNEGYSYHFELNYLMPSWLRDFCLEKHIDVFGLIPAGLAISKNEIDNQ